MLSLLIDECGGDYLFNGIETLGKSIWPFEEKWIKLNRLGMLCLRILSQWLFPSMPLDSVRSRVGLGLASAKNH